MRIVLSVAILSACADDAAKPPAAPSNLTVTSQQGGAHLVWTDNSSDEEEFVVMRKTADTAYVEAGRVPFDTSQFHDPIVSAGTAYTYKILAINGGGETASNEVPFTP